jgi:hypothetical protein
MADENALKDREMLQAHQRTFEDFVRFAFGASVAAAALLALLGLFLI